MSAPDDQFDFAHATTRTATTIGDHNDRGTQLVPTDSRLFPQRKVLRAKVDTIMPAWRHNWKR
jgi:hypothetical protein